MALKLEKFVCIFKEILKFQEKLAVLMENSDTEERFEIEFCRLVLKLNLLYFRVVEGVAENKVD